MDFVDLLTAFADAEVRYLLIGGYAKRAAGRDQDLVDARNLERTEG